MSRLLKVVGVLLALIVLAAGGLLAWVAWFVDADTYRRQIVERVGEYTGRTLSLEGDLSLELLPRIALETGAVALSPRPGFGEEPMVAADAVSVVVQLWPLLNGEVRVDRVVLDAPVLRLGVDADGESAWGDIVSRVRRETGQAADVSDGEALGAGMAALAVQGVEVREGAMYWTDGARGTTDAVTGLAASVDHLRSGETGRFELGGRIDAASFPEPIHLRLEGDITADFESLDIGVGNLVAQLGSDTVDADLSVSSTAVRDVRGDPVVTLEGVRLSATRGDTSFGFESPAAQLDVADDELRVPELMVDGAGLQAHGELTIGNLSVNPSLRARVGTDRLELATLLAAAGADASWLDADAAEGAAVTADIVADGSAVVADKLTVKVGQSDLAASLRLSLGDPMRIEARLTSDRLDLDGLLNDESPVEGAAAGAAAPLLAPLAVLHSVEGSVQARVGTLISSGLIYEDLAVDARADGKSVVIEPIRASLAGGRLDGAASMGKADPPPLTARLSFADADAGDLLSRLGLTDRLVGRGDLDLDFAAVGITQDKLRQSLDGVVAVNLREGLVRGLDIGRILDAARARDFAAASVPPDGEPVTRFSRFGASVEFDSGIGRSRDLELVGEGFRAEGEGVVDLPANRVDYRLAIFVAKTPSADGSAPDYEPVPIPLRISGDLDQPDFAVDVEALMKAEAERQLRREAAKRGIDAPDAKSAVQDYLKRKLRESLD